MTIKQHAAEAFQDTLIARATSFQVCLFLGVGKYARADAPSLDAARAEAQRLEAECQNGRRALIYAITDEGRPALIVDETRRWRSNMERTKMTADQRKAKDAERKRNERAAAKADRDAKALAANEALGRAVKAESEKHDRRAVSRGKRAAAAVKAGKLAEPTPLKQAVDAAIAARMSPKQFRKTAEAVADTLTKPAGGKRAAAAAAALASAQAGNLPTPPDMSAKTHKYYRRFLASFDAMIAAGDIAGLKADKMEAKSTSRILLCRYRDLAIIALEAQINYRNADLSHAAKMLS